MLSVDAQGGERLGSPRGTGGRRGQRREGTRALMPSMEARTGAGRGGHRGYEREGRAEGLGGCSRRDGQGWARPWRCECSGGARAGGGCRFAGATEGEGFISGCAALALRRKAEARCDMQGVRQAHL